MSRPVVIRLPPDLWDAVKKKAAENERSAAAEIRWALRQAIARAGEG